MRKSILLSLGLLSVVTLSSCVTDPDGIINEDRTKTLVETYSNDSVSKYESGNYHTISKTSGTIEPAIEGVDIEEEVNEEDTYISKDDIKVLTFEDIESKAFLYDFKDKSGIDFEDDDDPTTPKITDYESIAYEKHNGLLTITYKVDIDNYEVKDEETSLTMVISQHISAVCNYDELGLPSSRFYDIYAEMTLKSVSDEGESSLKITNKQSIEEVFTYFENDADNPIRPEQETK